MIAPRQRLVVAGALTILPLTVMAETIPGCLVWCVLLTIILLALPLIDLHRSWRWHRGLIIRSPVEVREIVGRPFQWPLTITTNSPCQIRIEPDLPEHLEWIRAPQTVSPPMVLEVEITPARRGRFRSTDIYFDWVSPWRLWNHRQRRSIDCTFLIHPDLSREGKRVARFLNRGGIGAHRQRQIGRGLEIEKLREYEPGDGFETIFWKATAKHRFPITKVYQIERAQEVYVAVDSSRLSSRPVPSYPPGTEVPLLERNIAATLLLATAAQRQSDRFGLVLFSDKVDKFVQARGDNFRVCRALLSALQAKPIAPDFVEVATRIMELVPRRSLIIFLTSLDDPVLAESFIQGAQMLARRHVVTTHLLVPPGIAPLFSPPEIKESEEIYERIAGHLRWKQITELKSWLSQRKVHLQISSTENLSIDAISSYLDFKRRQIL